MSRYQICAARIRISPLEGPCQGGNIITLTNKESKEISGAPGIIFGTKGSNKFSVVKPISSNYESQVFTFEAPSSYQSDCQDGSFKVPLTLEYTDSIRMDPIVCQFRNKYEYLEYQQSYNLTLLLAIIIPLIACFCIIGVASGIYYYKRKYKNSDNKKIAEYLENPGSAADNNNNFNAEVMQSLIKSKKNKSVILKKSDLKNIEKKPIGKGTFGVVYKCPSSNKSGDRSINNVDLACKAMINKNYRQTIGEIIEESKLMSKLDHPNIVKFKGIYIGSDEITNEKDDIFKQTMIVSEFMHKGDLETFLKNDKNKVTLKNLVKFCLDAATGLEYLSETMKVTHRDLAARNCMLTGDLSLKLADFGLARQGELYISVDNNVKLPIPWLSLEALLGTGKYDKYTDLWMYGVLCWEIFTRCNYMPYQCFGVFGTSEILKYLQGNRRLKRPIIVPKDMYIKLVSIWHEDPHMRPSITKIKQWFNLLEVKHIMVTKENSGFSSQQTCIEYSLKKKNDKPYWIEDNQKYVCKLKEGKLVCSNVVWAINSENPRISISSKSVENDNNEDVRDSMRLSSEVRQAFEDTFYEQPTPKGSINSRLSQSRSPTYQSVHNPNKDVQLMATGEIYGGIAQQPYATANTTDLNESAVYV